MTYLRKNRRPDLARACLRDASQSRTGRGKFRRQHARSPYITDFFCFETNLVIELDGESHCDGQAYDARRTVFLELNGCRVIRFLNDDVRLHLDAVLETIFTECQRLTASGPHPNPL